MPSKKKNVLRIILLITLVCFFLPFATVSCQNQDIKTFNGFDFVKGTEVDNGMGETQNINGTFPAIVAFIISIAALILSFILKDKAYFVLSAMSGALGVMFMFILNSQIAKEAEKQGLAVEFKAGYYLLLMSYIAVFLCSFIKFGAAKASPTIETKQDGR